MYMLHVYLVIYNCTFYKAFTTCDLFEAKLLDSSKYTWEICAVLNTFMAEAWGTESLLNVYS